MPLEPTKITDHIAAGLLRMLSQFKDKTLINGFIQSFIAGYQPAENAVHDCLSLRNIDDATGEQLDGIGEIVGKDRGGRTDNLYRIILYGKIGQNISQGTAQDVIGVYNLITQTNSSYMTEHWPAEIAIFADTPPVTGIQLLNDNDMEDAGTTAWTFVNAATLTKSVVAPQEGVQSLRVAYNAVNNPGASQSILTTGRWYWINGYTKMQDALGKVAVVKNGAVTLYTGFPFAGWYEFDIIFQATDPVINFGADFNAAKWIEYDNINIYELDIANQQEIFNVMELVAAGGVKVIGIGWYEAGEMFSFAGDVDGLGFGDLLNPTLGGKFASLTAIS